jgi:uncharacterized membrane protein YgdD (TMEM256/DUF423 family)
MRLIWSLGVLHALIGTAVLFLTFHPLRDALDAQALNLAIKGSALQLGQGLALMMLAHLSDSLTPGVLIALGTGLWAAMLYLIVFFGPNPLEAAVPLGGMIMIAGWVWLLLARPPGGV